MVRLATHCKASNAIETLSRRVHAVSVSIIRGVQLNGTETADTTKSRSLSKTQIKEAGERVKGHGRFDGDHQ